jgi:RNA polymerase sigma factor (sigma-70 family)
MRKYNIQNYIRYKDDLKKSMPEGLFWDEYTRDELIIKFLPLVENLAKKFSTSQQASGVLDITDLIQAGSLGLIKALDKLDWSIINNSKDPEQTFKAFISKRVKGAIRRAIDMNRSDMRLPEHTLNAIRKDDGATHTMTALFFNSIFQSTDEDDLFEDDPVMQVEDNGEPYKINIMNQYLLGIMNKYLTPVEYDVLRLSYGLDQDKLPAKEIAIHVGISVSTANVRVSQIKKNAIDTLIEKCDPELVVDLL